MEIIQRAIDSLIPYANNARKHSPEQVDKIAASIREFGFNSPILVNPEGTIIAGHARLAAAQKAGLKEVPTLCLSHLSKTAQKAYILADNRIALDSSWDMDLLRVEFESLKDDGFDLSLTGFTPEELEFPDLDAGNDGNCDPDNVPDVGDPVSVTGDLWILGNHRLLCGDSTEPTAVDRLLGESKPNLMVTDPPYGVNYDPEWRDGADLGVGKRSRGKVKNDDKVDWSEAYSLFTGDVVYVWHAGVYSPDVGHHIKQSGFDLVSQIIWVKQHFALSRGDYHWQHEPCWYAVRKGKNHNWQGARDQATTWQIKNNNSFGNSEKEKTWGHGTQKPLECMLRPIQNNSKSGESVYDPFGGSGTTLIACEKSGRKCLMMELDPVYCDTIVRRWQEFSGKEAVNESNGMTFREAENGKGRQKAARDN